MDYEILLDRGGSIEAGGVDSVVMNDNASLLEFRRANGEVLAAVHLGSLTAYRRKDMTTWKAPA